MKTTPPSDQATAEPDCSRWVRRALDGDNEAFEQLYCHYRPLVVRRLSHLVGPGDDAVVADLLQETFMRAFEKLPSYRGEAPIGHWLLRIATNLARTHHRQRRRSIWRLWREPAVESEIASTADRVDERYQQLRVVHRALDRLSPRLREAVILFELEGASLAEMASQLDVPLHTAASRVRRGRARLRQLLEKVGYAEPPATDVAFCEGEHVAGWTR